MKMHSVAQDIARSFHSQAVELCVHKPLVRVPLVLGADLQDGCCVIAHGGDGYMLQNDTLTSLTAVSETRT